MDKKEIYCWLGGMALAVGLGYTIMKYTGCEIPNPHVDVRGKTGQTIDQKELYHSKDKNE